MSISSTIGGLLSGTVGGFVTLAGNIALEGMKLLSCFVDPDKIEKKLQIKFDRRLTNFVHQTIEYLELDDEVNLLTEKVKNEPKYKSLLESKVKKFNNRKELLQNLAKKLIV